jgi:hypothetical protein
MTNAITHRRYGNTLAEWIRQIPAELPADAVGLWQIIPEAREDFGLEGEDLTRCVKQALLALVAAGAKPVRSGKSTGHHWIEQTHYGSDAEEVVGNIIAEWRGWGMGDPTVGGLWFALPELFG